MLMNPTSRERKCFVSSFGRSKGLWAPSVHGQGTRCAQLINRALVCQKKPQNLRIGASQVQKWIQQSQNRGHTMSVHVLSSG